MSNNDKQSFRKRFKLFKEDIFYNLRSVSLRKKIVPLLKLALLLFILIGIPIILIILLRKNIFSWDTLTNLPTLLESKKSIAWLILTLLQSLQVIISMIPGQPIQYASSYLYGILGGYLVSIAGAMLGTFIIYKIARFLGHDAMELMVGKERFTDYMHKLDSSRSQLIIFLIYLIPAIPKDIMAYVAGISSMKLSHFMIISTLGRTPGILGSLLIGMFWQQKNYVGLAIVAIASIAIFAVCYKFKDKVMARISNLETKVDSKEKEAGK